MLLACLLPSRALNSLILLGELRHLGLVLHSLHLTPRLGWRPAPSACLYTLPSARLLGPGRRGNGSSLPGCLRRYAGWRFNANVGVPLSRGKHSHLKGKDHHMRMPHMHERRLMGSLSANESLAPVCLLGQGTHPHRQLGPHDYETCMLHLETPTREGEM